MEGERQNMLDDPGKSLSCVKTKVGLKKKDYILIQAERFA